MKVIEIRSEAEWQSLRSEWETLLCDSASGATFLTYEWATAWWQAYGRPGELRILAALDDAGVLRGIAGVDGREARCHPNIGHNDPKLFGRNNAPDQLLQFCNFALRDGEAGSGRSF